MNIRPAFKSFVQKSGAKAENVQEFKTEADKAEALLPTFFKETSLINELPVEDRLAQAKTAAVEGLMEAFPELLTLARDFSMETDAAVQDEMSQDALVAASVPINYQESETPGIFSVDLHQVDMRWTTEKNHLPERLATVFVDTTPGEDNIGYLVSR